MYIRSFIRNSSAKLVVAGIKVKRELFKRGAPDSFCDTGKEGDAK